jgi:hypothetical protein
MGEEIVATTFNDSIDSFRQMQKKVYKKGISSPFRANFTAFAIR